MKKHTSIPKLSKSRFMAGWQCPKRLWYQLYEPDEAAETDAGTQLILDQGTLAGEMARGYFPGGELIDEDHLHHSQAAEHTARALQQDSLPALYEAAFLHDEVRVRVDLLPRAGKGSFDLVEVKSTKQVNPEHLWDVAIQAYVVQGAGIPLRGLSLMHLNGAYVYPGGDHEPRELFTLEDVTSDVKRRLPEIPRLLATMRAPLWFNTPPDVAIGEQCYAPYKCPFIAHCHPRGPEHPVTDLYRAGRGLRERLQADGLASILDIPEAYEGLSEINRRIRDAVISGKPYLSAGAKRELASLSAPVYFLDFETINPAVPLYKGTSPYQIIPFQWSSHRVDRTGIEEAGIDAGRRAQHAEYLHDGPDDPRPGFVESLLKALGEKGAICVYSSYEERCLKELQQAFPKFAKPIGALRERLVNLLPIVRENVYHPDFRGSFSIKSVYPAIVSGSGYDDLAIGDGSSAAAAYMQSIAPTTPPEQRERLRRDLLAYCKLDTQAMLDLVRTLIS